MSATVRLLRRIGVTVIGVLLVILGIVLIPLPGPGTLIVVAGLWVLGTEFRRPREWSERIRQRARDVLDRVTH